MHIELSPKYATCLNNLIQNLNLNAHTTDSFNASGETIILSASKEELQKILESNEEDGTNSESENSSASSFIYEGLKAIIKEQMG
ncbi:hypothetical protein [Desertivirga brevis]|uniref:hypothetical protein n=1 Tax=Desertivirga brevis TaxID=2810310 RepID=UPI001A97B7FA|nr:hypothetical protein [Pedobacter sp. SYSU D00873]